MKKIPLAGKWGKGQFALVDERDYEKLLLMGGWIVFNSRGKPYVIRSSKVNGKRKNLFMHRIILSASDADRVDHINGNTLDNRRSNIRICTLSQNGANRPMQQNNTTGYKGVFYDARCIYRPYYSKVHYRGKQIRIGCYKTKEEAALAYNKKAVELWGEFALLNIVKGNGEAPFPAPPQVVTPRPHRPAARPAGRAGK